MIQNKYQLSHIFFDVRYGTVFIQEMKYHEIWISAVSAKLPSA